MAKLVLIINEEEEILDQEKKLYGFECSQEITGKCSDISFLPILAHLLPKMILRIADVFNLTIEGEILMRGSSVCDRSETIKQLIAKLAIELKAKTETNQFPEELEVK